MRHRIRAGTSTGWLATLALLVAGVLAPSSALAASDLSMTKVDSADPVDEGTEFTYTLTASNTGPDPANGVEVVDQLPNKLDFIAATSSQGTCSDQGRKVTCDLGALATDAVATVTIRVNAKKAGSLSNTATVTTADPDSNPQNNSDTESTTVVSPDQPPTCAGKKATIVGRPGADDLIGTSQRDVIVGLGGNDTIKGRGGNDIICGSGGDDEISGQGGNDLLLGGGGSDLLLGGGGDDVLRGRGGDDQLRGGGGDDLLRGGAGSDALRGGRGNDTLLGGGGDDSCRGAGDTKRSC